MEANKVTRPPRTLRSTYLPEVPHGPVRGRPFHGHIHGSTPGITPIHRLPLSDDSPLCLPRYTVLGRGFLSEIAIHEAEGDREADIHWESYRGSDEFYHSMVRFDECDLIHCVGNTQKPSPAMVK